MHGLHPCDRPTINNLLVKANDANIVMEKDANPGMVKIAYKTAIIAKTKYGRSTIR